MSVAPSPLRSPGFVPGPAGKSDRSAPGSVHLLRLFDEDDRAQPAGGRIHHGDELGSFRRKPELEAVAPLALIVQDGHDLLLAENLELLSDGHHGDADRGPAVYSGEPLGREVNPSLSVQSSGLEGRRVESEGGFHRPAPTRRRGVGVERLDSGDRIGTGGRGRRCRSREGCHPD